MRTTVVNSSEAKGVATQLMTTGKQKQLISSTTTNQDVDASTLIFQDNYMFAQHQSEKDACTNKSRLYNLDPHPRIYTFIYIHVCVHACTHIQRNM